VGYGRCDYTFTQTNNIRYYYSIMTLEYIERSFNGINLILEVDIFIAGYF